MYIIYGYLIISVTWKNKITEIIHKFIDETRFYTFYGIFSTFTYL